MFSLPTELLFDMIITVVKGDCFSLFLFPAVVTSLYCRISNEKKPDVVIGDVRMFSTVKGSFRK